MNNDGGKIGVVGYVLRFEVFRCRNVQRVWSSATAEKGTKDGRRVEIASKSTKANYDMI